ncbi:uncharacterized protein [Solanum lycopersicum]|uniref:uncharacterized protein n=1 Tax=Solanum lycopersicum TaxID=4081 RepID=UPI003749FE3C
MDPLKYIFQKGMPTGKLAKWQMLLSEFDIVYVTQKAIKAQALADHLAENPVDEEYEPLKTYFHNEEVSFVGEDISEAYLGWRLFFDRAVNHQGKGVGAVLVSESGQHYPMVAKLRFNCTNNMAEYEACILGLKMAIDMNVYELLVIGDSDLLIHQVQGEWAVKNPKIVPYVQYVQNLCKRFRKIEFRHTPRIQNELADALATIASMIKHPDTDYIDPLDIDLKEHPVHCSHVESEPDGLPWYFDIKRYLESGTYPEDATSIQKNSISRMALNFFLNGEVLYRRTPDLGLLRCVDAAEAVRLIEQIHTGVCGTHMNGLTLARKVLRAGYFWMTMEHNCSSYKLITKKVVVDFVRNNLICRFGVPESIITDNGANLNSHLMKEICEQFKIIHRRSTAYRPQMNGAVEAANKNIKKILRKMIDKQRGWHEMLPYALLGYRTTVRTSTGATPYLLVYGTEAVVPVEVEIPSLRIIQEAELSNA